MKPFLKTFLASLSALYIWRMPILLSLILLALPLLSGNEFVSGLYYLPGYSPLFVGMLIAFLAAQIFVELRILQVHGPERLGTDLAVNGDPFVRRLSRWFLSLALSLGPLILNEYKVRTMAASTDRGGVTALSLAGIAIVAVLFLLLVLWHNRPAQPGDLPIFSMRNAPAPAQQTGPFKGFAANGHILSGHLLAAGLVALVLIVYLLGLAINFTALVYLLLLLSLSAWFFGLLCFVLDMYRIPAIVSVALIGFLFSLIPANEHYYPVSTPGAFSLPPAQAIFNGQSPGVIVISAEGGGILSSAWTNQVLTGILEKLNPAEQIQFLSSVRLLSGVSGGSTGLMYFQTLCGRSTPSSEADLQAVRNAATADDALGWVGYGIVYYDLLRPLWPYWAYSVRDRGETLERAWKTDLAKLLNGAKLPTMRDLSAGVEAGTRPLLMLNATIADSGRPIAITNFVLPPDPDIASFYQLYFKTFDIDLTTAVRMSATFPYVSPIARPIVGGKPVSPNLGLSDGGYSDNFGVAPAYLALTGATDKFKNIAKPVLWIQIHASKDYGGGGNYDKLEKIASTGVGPIWTLYGVRSTGQRARLRRLNELVSIQMKDKLKIVFFEYSSDDSPLSWILSTEQKDQIKTVWTKGDWDAQLNDIHAFLNH